MQNLKLKSFAKIPIRINILGSLNLVPSFLAFVNRYLISNHFYVLSRFISTVSRLMPLPRKISQINPRNVKKWFSVEFLVSSSFKMIKVYSNIVTIHAARYEINDPAWYLSAHKTYDIATSTYLIGSCKQFDGNEIKPLHIHVRFVIHLLQNCYV